MFKNLPTSKKVSLYFSFFSFISLTLLLISINIIYFVIWYNDQKKESMLDLNQSYNSYVKNNSDYKHLENFKNYVLSKDVLIIPTVGKPICSSTLTTKTKENIEVLQNKKYYKYDNKIYLVFSNSYDNLGEVKIFFDTTNYINSQIIMIKLSLIIIFISVFLNYFFGKIIVSKSLKNLSKIKDYCQNLDVDNNYLPINIDGSNDDEIKIVSEKLNNVLLKIKNQNENLKQFISDVSHEFKTPLMALNSKNDIFSIKNEKSTLDKNEISDFLDYNKKYIKKLDKILEALFLITRLKDKNIKLNLIKTNIKKHILTLIKEKEVKNIEIKGDLELEIDNITFDIIIENLINNAIKYGDNKKIIISLNKEFISIKDNGIGINKENLYKLFDNFFKENPESEGFGIGLYLVKRLLDIYNWKIEVLSEKGKGSEFKIYF